MPSITTWTRLEPHCRSEDMRDSLQARVRDPLWLLARQWQFGEYRGADTGSPVIARYRGEASQLNRYVEGLPTPGGRFVAKEFETDELPLEALVERERVRIEAGAWLRLAAEAGLHFLRLLGSEGVSEATRMGYVNAYPLGPAAELRQALDSDTLRFLGVMERRVPHGANLYAAMRQAHNQTDGSAWGLPAEYPIDSPAEIAKVAQAAEKWLAWYDGLFSEPSDEASAWMPERMEYGFAVSTRTADGEVVLTAPEYAQGHLDWHSFNVDTSVSLGATLDVAPVVATSIPAPISFRGMPAARLWEFEDSQIDLGTVDAEPEDLARLLLVEFSLIYGNDWFVMPIELRIGSICRPRSLVVTDTFGVRTLIRPYTDVDGAQTSWRMFHISSEFFFVPPALTASFQGVPIEEVLFLRDEMANMVWAVERIVESPSGKRLKRFEEFQQEQERLRREDEPSESVQLPLPADRPLEYSLASGVPSYWIPFLPSKIDERSIRLRQGTMLQSDGTPAPLRPRGRILEPHPALNLYEEEIPRAGARITRAYQYARWINGSTHLWVGRQKRPGGGEGSSGLRFDIVEPAAQPSSAR